MERTKNAKLIEAELDCIYEDKSESLIEHMKQDEFFQLCRDHFPNIPAILKTQLFLNIQLLDDDGEQIIEELFKELDSEADLVKLKEEYSKSSTGNPLPYSTLSSISDISSNNSDTPMESIYRKIQCKQRENRGITTKKNSIFINPNIFSKYVLKRAKIIQTSTGEKYIYDKTGVYKDLGTILLKKICRGILHEYQEDIWTRKLENEYLAALDVDIPIVEDIGLHSEYINLKNGMFSIATMSLYPHDPAYFSTIQSEIEYDKDQVCPQFESFLKDIFDDDKEIIDLVQEIIGYCFLQAVKIHKAFIFYGAGSNGKSILAEVIRRLLGAANVSNVPLDKLEGTFGMQNLPGKLANISAENELSKKFNTQSFKTITSGDAVEVEKKYKDSYSTSLIAKMIILVNKLMDSDDRSEGYYRRLLIIPFNKMYIERKAGEPAEKGVSYMDKNLLEKLGKEMSGIFNFAMEGLKRLIENDFNLTRSRVCDKALSDYRATQNPVIEFFEDMIVPIKTTSTKRSKFKESFTVWASKNGYSDFINIGASKFWNLLKAVLTSKNIQLKEKKIKGIIYVEGLALKNLKEERGSAVVYEEPEIDEILEG